MFSFNKLKVVKVELICCCKKEEKKEEKKKREIFAYCNKLLRLV